MFFNKWRLHQAVKKEKKLENSNQTQYNEELSFDITVSIKTDFHPCHKKRVDYTPKISDNIGI